MKAMIFAAGLGTRLRPLTDTIPKALIELNGTPLLQLVIERLKQFDVTEIIINVHHHSQQIIDFVVRHQAFGIRIEFSREKHLLNTGGGLKKAAWFFNDGRPFIVHNVDVLSDVDFRQMLSAHEESDALATLAVRKRNTSRYLLFDENNRLCGWRSVNKRQEKIVRACGRSPKPFSFMGIHILSPEIFDFLPPEDNFSIIDSYLSMASENQTIRAFPADDFRWIDLGKKEAFKEAQNLFPELKENKGTGE